MNKIENNDNWNFTKGKRRQTWDKLTNDDLQYAAVKQDGMLGRILKRNGENREAVEKAVREASSSG